MGYIGVLYRNELEATSRACQGRRGGAIGPDYNVRGRGSPRFECPGYRNADGILLGLAIAINQPHGYVPRRRFLTRWCRIRSSLSHQLTRLAGVPRC
jgi:hypothetical protein